MSTGDRAVSTIVCATHGHGCTSLIAMAKSFWSTDLLRHPAIEPSLHCPGVRAAIQARAGVPLGVGGEAVLQRPLDVDGARRAGERGVAVGGDLGCAAGRAGPT